MPGRFAGPSSQVHARAEVTKHDARTGDEDDGLLVFVNLTFILLAAEFAPTINTLNSVILSSRPLATRTDGTEIYMCKYMCTDMYRT